MERLTLQIIAGAFAIFALSRAYLRFKERKLSSFSFIFWIFIWVTGMAAIVFPNISTEFARIIGVGRGADAVLYASIVVIFYLIFRLYIKIEDTQKEITKLVRVIALLDFKSKKKSLKK